MNRWVLSWVAVCALAACGSPKGSNDGGSAALPPCANTMGLAVAVSGSGATLQVKASFDPETFISSWDWFKVPASAVNETCHQYTSADLKKRVTVDSANIVAGKVATGYVTFDTLPVPASGAGYCWKSSTNVTACYQQGITDLYAADPGLTLAAGTYEVAFYKPGVPHAEEIGRARFTVP